MYDIRNRKVPSNILNLFSDTTSIHSLVSLGLRQQINSILRNLCQKSKKELRVGAKIWNEMPALFRELPKDFQTKLDSFLLDILKRYDDYIDISQI